MSCVGGNLFYGFELSKKYIEKLMSYYPKDQWGFEGYSELCDVVPQIEELVEGINVEVSCHGTQDGRTFFVCIKDYYVHAGESEIINLDKPNKSEIANLLKAIKKLKSNTKEDKIGWHLAAFWD